MYKRIYIITLSVFMLLLMNACGKTKILHCDSCKKEVLVSESSNMEEDWIVLCQECDDVDIDIDK